MNSSSEDEDAGSRGPGQGDDATARKREPVTAIAPSLSDWKVQLATPVDQEPFPVLYKSRLREIWEATHPGQTVPDSDTGSWGFLQEVVNAVGIPKRIGDAGPQKLESLAESTGGAALTGDPYAVELQVSAAVEQLSPDQIPAFISGLLVSTVERLEGEIGRTEGATRERIVDIVVRAVIPLRGSSLVGRLVPGLFSYLLGDDRPPTPGRYMTVVNLAQLIAGLDDRRNRLMRSLLYHAGMLGVWGLLQDQDTAFDGTVRQVVAVAADNAGANLWRLLPRQAASAPGAEVVRGLRVILISTTPLLRVSEAQAAAVLEVLGLSYPRGRDALTVLDMAGSLGGVWTDDAIDMSRAESAAAVAAMAAAYEPDQVTNRLYNAAVSLQGVPEPQSPGPQRARMLLSALGLRWSLLLGSDVLDALDRAEGVDCAYSFLRAYTHYLDEGHEQAPSWPAVAELAELIAELAAQLPRDRPSLATGATRLADAARLVMRRRVVAAREIGQRTLLDATAQAIDALRASGTTPDSMDPVDQMADTASALGGMYAEILVRPEWGLYDTVGGLIESRADPRREFITRYRPFAEPPERPLGTAPPVLAGVVTGPQWDSLETDLLTAQGSIGAVLRQEFSARA